MEKHSENTPLKSLDVWEDDLLSRYPDPENIAQKSTEEFRNYDKTEKDGVREFYRLNHKYQTYDFVLQKEKEFFEIRQEGNARMGRISVSQSACR